MQPVVTLTIVGGSHGGDRADISVGDTLTFQANIKAPPGTGKVTSAEFDFYGVGDYPHSVDIGTIRPDVDVELSRTYRQAARKRGTHLGRPRGVTEGQEARVRRLRAQGRSIREIAHLVSLPRTTVHRVVQAAVPEVPDESPLQALAKYAE